MDKFESKWLFELTSEDEYVSHDQPSEEHGSALEAGFSERFDKLETPWQLEWEGTCSRGREG